MGFSPLPNNKRPIYVIEQQNEAMYIKLHSTAVSATPMFRGGVEGTGGLDAGQPHTG
jgi:hypothetical protein